MKKFNASNGFYLKSFDFKLIIFSILSIIEKIPSNQRERFKAVMLSKTSILNYQSTGKNDRVSLFPLYC
jgi:hypothetical protein